MHPLHAEQSDLKSSQVCWPTDQAGRMAYETTCSALTPAALSTECKPHACLFEHAWGPLPRSAAGSQTSVGKYHQHPAAACCQVSRGLLLRHFTLHRSGTSQCRPHSAAAEAVQVNASRAHVAVHPMAVTSDPAAHGVAKSGHMLRGTPTTAAPAMIMAPPGETQRSFTRDHQASCAGGGRRQQLRPPAVPAAGRADEAAVLQGDEGVRRQTRRGRLCDKKRFSAGPGGNQTGTAAACVTVAPAATCRTGTMC